MAAPFATNGRGEPGSPLPPENASHLAMANYSSFHSGCAT